MAKPRLGGADGSLGKGGAAETIGISLHPILQAKLAATALQNVRLWARQSFMLLLHCFKKGFGVDTYEGC